MTREGVLRKVIELAAKGAGVDPATVFPASHFVNDLGFDSLDVVEFAMAVEDEWGVSIPDEDVEKLSTVEEVVEYLLKRLQATVA